MMTASHLDAESFPPGRLRLQSDVSVELSHDPPGKMRSVSESTRTIIRNTFRENIPSGQIKSRAVDEIMTHSSPPGDVRKPSGTFKMYMNETNDQGPVEHPEIFQEQNLPPYVIFNPHSYSHLFNKIDIHTHIYA